ncbi:MAG: 3-hydroxyacyl-CoA dehydrogenase, partial [Deltaproteobacteria bacterium]|nr:3-hydroxyacyl-CoA dehydrogenase [Deltaproteobacteria bacterium]
MIENITVIGAGTMGLGLGHVAALAGYNVTLNDISMDILNQALDAIKKNMEKGIERGKLDKAAMDAAMERIDLEADMEKASKEADLIIEAIIEKLDVKCELF